LSIIGSQPRAIGPDPCLKHGEEPQELLTKWHQEAQAAMGAINAGAVQVWKDAADTVVYAILTVEADDPAQAHGNVLNIFGSLPMGVSGEIIIEEARSVL
jgi:hypothetical protein